MFIKMIVSLLFVMSVSLAYAEDDNIQIAYEDYNGPVFALDSCTVEGCKVESSGVFVPNSTLLKQLPVVATTGCHSYAGVCVLNDGHPYGVSQEYRNRRFQ